RFVYETDYYLDELQKKNKLFAMVYLNASYNIRPNFSVFATGVYSSPQLIDNLNVDYSCNISFGGNLKLLKNRLSLRLAVNDILARSVTPYWTSYSPNLYRTRRNHYDTRGVALTVTYNFTFVKKKYSELDNAEDYDRM
ncbi:MAG: outer membrane beta-barrel family protein, partial [Muribaculaceae bacterium]|nr:outer membrane beta-barrel family protein [Muribaculaceae bacterium]